MEIRHQIIPQVALPDGTMVPAVGQGTWHMGEARGRAAEEVAALRQGIELGMTLIDTAEMYGEGGAERVVAQAIAGQRDRIFLVSKIYPHHASASGVGKACAASLARLGTEWIDLYLLHWRGGYPLEDTVGAFERLREEGYIRYWGVSNFDTDDMAEVAALPAGAACATNQVLYNPESRGIEFDLMPWCRARSIPIMAYTPLGQAGHLLRSPALVSVVTERRRRRSRLPGAYGMVRRSRSRRRWFPPTCSRSPPRRRSGSAMRI